MAEITAAGGSAVADSHGRANGGTLERMPPAELERMLDIHVGGEGAVTRAA